MMDASEQRAELKRILAVAKSGKFLVLDTETTGLYDGEICEVSVIDQDGKVVYYSLVKPVLGIPADATRIHGITNDRVSQAPGFATVAPFLTQHLIDRDVLIYNAIYDRKMLHQSAEKAGMERIAWKEFSRWHCVMEAFAVANDNFSSYHGRYIWRKLSEAAAHYGIEPQSSHSALADCRTTLAVVNRMLETNGKPPRKYGDDA